MGIDGNEIPDQLATQGSSHPLTGPQPALGISATVASGNDQGMEKYETQELAAHTWKKAG
jgi:hypothetical protein